MYKKLKKKKKKNLDQVEIPTYGGNHDEKCNQNVWQKSINKWIQDLYFPTPIVRLWYVQFEHLDHQPIDREFECKWKYYWSFSGEREK